MESTSDKTYVLVISELMKYFEDNQFQPGDKLPPEEILASKLYIGRPTLREALRILDMMGVIQSSRGKSNVYMKNMNEGIRSFFVMFTLLYEDAYEGLAQLRANIEVLAVEAFIKNATSMDIMELEYLQHKFLEEKDTELVSCLDDAPHIEFHLTLLKFSASEFEKDFVTLCICSQMLYRIKTSCSLDLARGKGLRGGRSHKDLIEAIKANDVEAAKRIVRNHVLYYSDILTST